MWQHVTIEPEDDQTESAIEYEKLTIGAGGTSLEIIYEANGRFFIQATNSCDAEINIGETETLDAAKKLAERWALAQIAEMLKSLGAEGIWMVRGAQRARLKYFRDEPAPEFDTFWINLEPPMERILLIRFPAGDGEREGIEHF